MGSSCSRRRSEAQVPFAEAAAAQVPLAEAVAAHKASLAKLRMEFGHSFRKCKLKKDEAKLKIWADSASEVRWKWIIERRMVKYRHHQMSQLLKEVAHLKRFAQ